MLRDWFRAPHLALDWKPLLALAWVVFWVTFAVHFAEYGEWDQEALKIDGEPIMGTHDAYHWLAGAKGVGLAKGEPLALYAAGASKLTGASLDKTGFWSPILFAGLTAIATLLWAWSLGGLEAGLAAGTLAALAPGFFFRSRFGYFDTDMVTLLFPLLVSWGAATALTPFLRSSWIPASLLFGGTRPRDEPPKIAAHEAAAMRLFSFMLAAGLLARFSVSWHGQLALFNILLFCLAAGLILACAIPSRRVLALWGLLVFGLPAMLGWPGLAAALVLMGAMRFFPALFSRIPDKAWVVLLLMALLLSQAGAAQSFWTHANAFIGVYLKPVTQQTNASLALADNATKLAYPGITQSVIEAQNVPFKRLMARYYPIMAVSTLGVLGFGVTLAARPQALFLLPLLLLGLSSVVLGSRMAMFGAPAIALGLVLPLAWLGNALLAKYAWRRWAQIGVHSLLALFLILPVMSLYSTLQPTPVLNPAHCHILKELGAAAPANSRVWTWWDWGYATHYFAGRLSFSDGGQHSGEYIYTLGRALTTSSFRQSNQLIKFSALHKYQPWTVWNKQTPREVNAFLDELSRADKGYAPKDKQYVVVTMENIPLIPWISFYGTWDLAAQTGARAKIYRIDEPFTFEETKGLIVFEEKGEAIPVGSADLLSSEDRRSYTYPKSKGLHLIRYPEADIAYLLDDLAYRSMMIQLLLADPESPEVKPYFRLAHDAFPLVRVFEAK